MVKHSQFHFTLSRLFYANEMLHHHTATNFDLYSTYTYVTFDYMATNVSIFVSMDVWMSIYLFSYTHTHK